MNNNQLNRALNLIKKTGDKLVVADKDSDNIYVIMDLLDYEELQGMYDDFLDSDCDQEYFDDVCDHDRDDFDDWNEIDKIDKIDVEEEDEEEADDDIPDFSKELNNFFEEDEEDAENSIAENNISEEPQQDEELNFEEKIKVEDADFLPKQVGVEPPYASVNEVLKKKEFLNEDDEPVMEKINHIDEGLAEIKEFEEESFDDSMLSEEDKDRFYLEPV